MNFIKTFEQRVADAFGAAPQGYTAPFSFKKLAKRAAREMEAETYVIDGVDTAPGLFTILVSQPDDQAMRGLYPQLTSEIVAFVEAQAAAKNYVFVAEPLARFMVDPALRSGKFAVFAENVDYDTIERLREEERQFLSGSAGIGGAAADLAQRPRQASGVSPHGNARVVTPVSTPAEQVPMFHVKHDEVNLFPDSRAASAHDFTGDDVGLGVMPTAYAAAPEVPRTRLRPTPAQPAPRPEPPAPAASCLLIDRQSGRTYSGTAPRTVLGRERVAGGIILGDPNVSRRHAELLHDGRGWRIHDLGSTNGTLVNDTDVDQAVLHDGDVITVGLTNLEFRSA